MIQVVVVDTNVPVAASGRSGQASPHCVLACKQAILRVMTHEVRLALDSDWQIITEYRRNLSSSGEPGLADEFLTWVLTNRANPERCDMVSLTPNPGDPSDFEEFPRVAGLENFDPADRKFVAVANAHAARPPILQALDSRWWGWRKALALAGITVEFLCSAEVKRTYERKSGRRARQTKRPRRG